MESIYLGIVIFLFLLAIFDLTVGVSNDAVNFLNSAIGAKAASFKTIILIAAVGIDRYFRYFPIGGYRFLFRNAGAIPVADYLYL